MTFLVKVRFDCSQDTRLDKFFSHHFNFSRPDNKMQVLHLCAERGTLRIRRIYEHRQDDRGIVSTDGR
jgi:hypothetical protein